MFAHVFTNVSSLLFCRLGQFHRGRLPDPTCGNSYITLHYTFRLPKGLKRISSDHLSTVHASFRRIYLFIAIASVYVYVSKRKST